MQKKITFFTLFTIFSTVICAQSISNTEVKPDENSIKINYTLDCLKKVSIELYFSGDNGSTWEGPLKSVSGDVGKNITPGQKQIIWDVLKDKEIFIAENAIFKIKGVSIFGSFKDQRDNKTYLTINVNDQKWMAENLNYRIPLSSWYYNDDSVVYFKYGRLYDWNTATKICPDGWHLPGNSEWEALINTLGGSKLAGIKLKSASGWISPNPIPTNEIEFSALPGGYRKSNGNFAGEGIIGNFWSSTLFNGDSPYNISFKNTSQEVELTSNSINLGLNVRCIQHRDVSSQNSDLISQNSTVFYEVSKPTAVAIIKDGYPVNKIPPSIFIKKYIDKNLIEWQKKGEFEKSSDYKIRISELSIKNKVLEWTANAEEAYKTEYAKTIDWSKFQISQYDADNEIFTITSELFVSFAIHVPIKEAPSLKQNWKNVRFKDPDFIITKDNIKLSKVTIINPENGYAYIYGNDKSSPENNIISQNKEDSLSVQNGDQNQISQQQPAVSYKEFSYSELVDLQMKAVSSEEFEKAKKIQEEITKRELSGKYSDIPAERLEKILQEAVKSEDFDKAAKIQDELNNRKK